LDLTSPTLSIFNINQHVSKNFALKIIQQYNKLPNFRLTYDLRDMFKCTVASIGTFLTRIKNHTDINVQHMTSSLLYYETMLLILIIKYTLFNRVIRRLNLQEIKSIIHKI